MDYTASIPFNLAVQRLAGKTPVASELRTAEWSDMPLELRERGQFSAAVNELSVMQGVQDRMMKAVNWQQLQGKDESFMSKEKFIAEMRNQMGAPDGDSGKLTDITSAKRLGLIYDQQITDAYEFGRWKMGQTPALLAQYPAQELIRREQREHPRDWITRWTGNGGRLYAGRMIALKDDPIWTAISRFGTPFPPFDFGSGMGVEVVSRDEAIELGVITEDDPPPEPSTATYNDDLQASVSDLSLEKQAALKQAFGDQVQIADGKATWLGSGKLLQREYADAQASDTAQQGKIDFGLLRPETIRQLLDAGADVGDEVSKTVNRENLWHIAQGHDEVHEAQKGQAPIDADTVKWINFAMDHPSTVSRPDNPRETQPNRYQITSDIDQVGTMHLFVDATKHTLRLITAYIKK